MNEELIARVQVMIACHPHIDDEEEQLIRDLLTANADLLAENKRLKEAMEWQDIETAPKDGTDVIVMYMHIETQVLHNAFFAREDEGWDKDDCGWWSYEHSEVSRIKLDGWMRPTHWMPLPTPPQEQTR